MRAFVSWSGGKDSGLALFSAQKNDIDVCYLFNMTSENGTHSRSHGLSSHILAAQAESLQIPLFQAAASWHDYESVFKKSIHHLIEKEGITAGIFGDIDILEHRQWVERVCREFGIEPILPLWLWDRTELMETLVQEDFEAVVVATNASLMGEEWLGKPINEDLIKGLIEKGNIDLCGERGEYHTLLCDGPMFKLRIVPTRTEKIKMDHYWFLNIKEFFLEEKS